MKSFKHFSIALAAAALTASTLYAQAFGCAAVVAGSQEKSKGKFESTFSATEIIDIDLSALFNNGVYKKLGDGEHIAEFRIYTPKGHLYQSISVPFSGDVRKAKTPKQVPGYPRPIAIKALEPATFGNAPHYAVSARLPVAGTPIMMNSLYGSWSVEVLIDGEQAPCGSKSQFTITQ